MGKIDEKVKAIANEADLVNAKYKSAASKFSDAGMVAHAMEWKPSLMKRVNANGDIENVTLRIRILGASAERDIQLRFQPGNHTGKSICEAVAQKEQISPSEARIFSLWVISKSLEVQVRPNVDIVELMSRWNEWMLKYTHYSDSANSAHAINQYVFCYKREASISLNEEASMISNASAKMLYGLVRFE